MVSSKELQKVLFKLQSWFGDCVITVQVIFVLLAHSVVELNCILMRCNTIHVCTKVAFLPLGSIYLCFFSFADQQTAIHTTAMAVGGRALLGEVQQQRTRHLPPSNALRTTPSRTFRTTPM